MDILAIRLTISEAQRLVERLEIALDAGDNKAVGDALYHLKRELLTLARMTELNKRSPHDKTTH